MDLPELDPMIAQSWGCTRAFAAPAGMNWNEVMIVGRRVVDHFAQGGGLILPDLDFDS